MPIFKTFPENEISARESRLIFADKNSDGEKSADENFVFRPDVEEWKNSSLAEYEKHLKKAKELGEIDETTFGAKTREAKRLFEKWDEEKKKETPANNLKKRIERARRNREDKKLVDKTVDAVRANFLADAAEIRKFVRDEIRDFLKIKTDDIEKEFGEKAFEEFLDFETEIWDSIAGLLKKENYSEINATIDRDKTRAKKCYRILREIFHNEDKKQFLELFAKTKGIPAGSRMDVRELLELAQKMEGRWDESDTLVGVVDAQEIRGLEQSLGAIEMLFERWEKNKNEAVLAENELQKKLFEYEKNLGNFAAEMRDNPPKSVALAWLVETWPDILERKKLDLAQIKKIFATKKSEPNRRLAQIFLEGNAEELEELRKAVVDGETTAKTPPPDADEKKTPVAEMESTSAPELGRGGDAGHDEHAGNAFNQFGKVTKNFFTAHGRIKWYSVHDIGQAFHLVKEAWKKHTESHTEDKSGGVAKNMMFWRKEIQRRVHETDLIAEKGRADERKKHYKNFSYEELIAELIERPAKDKRRAILETLAERGNLRMSDHRLIDAITNKSITTEEWNYADSICDYVEISRKFKNAIDKNFIGETGYGQQLIDMQTSGQANKESLGERLGDHAVTGSPGAECAIVAAQIDNAGLEGDNILTGLLRKGFDRGNKFADNGAMCDIEIRTERNNHDKIHEGASAGLDALKIVDGYLKGLLSNQTIQGISKKNEGAYTPFAALQDVLINKDKRDPENPSRAISSLELWGWIRNGVITNLGRRQIINFFDSRVAFDSAGNIIHIAKNSGTYSRHSAKYTSITELRGKVGDKMRTTCIKAGGTEIYDNATQRSQANNQIVGQQQEVTFLIKAACEEIEDGITMIRHGQGEKMKEEGEARLEKGTQALEIMFGNIIKNTSDRDPFLRGDGNPAYNFMERDKNINDKESYGAIVGKKKNEGLRAFLEYYLGENVTDAKNDLAFRRNYNRVMRALENLEDKSKILSREARDAKNRADDEELRGRYRDAA